MNVRDNTSFLHKLTSAPSPSGFENAATEVFKNEVMEYLERGCESDKFGNVWFSCGHGQKKILLSAHIDEVYAVVTSISDDGMVSIGPAGGIDKKDLPASKVVFLKDNGILTGGIVIKNPIHIEYREETQDKVLKFEDLKVDVGCDTREEVLNRGIHPGTPVLYERLCNFNFGKNRMYSNGLDDKIGVFVAEEIFRSLLISKDKNWMDEYTVVLLAATQEEVGCRGVCVAAREINPDISIDFDVTFATDGDMDLNKAKYGDISLGKGPVICYGPEKSLRLNLALKEAASGFYQEEAGGRAGGTNTDNIQKFSANCETTLVSIPNRSMHTRVETCDWRDVQGAVDMVTNAIIKCKL
jgi:putative aminopeptidase FrvX